jgi:hypothetical protein
MPTRMTFSPPNPFFASSSPRHHFFFPSSFFPRHLHCPFSSSFSSSPLRTNERTIERLNERKITLTSSQHLANLLAYHDHISFSTLDLAYDDDDDDKEDDNDDDDSPTALYHYITR